MPANSKIQIDFIRSALAVDSRTSPTKDIIAWIRKKNLEVTSKVEERPLSELRNWIIDESTGDISHVSGKFFSIEGVRVKTNWGNIPEWDQPIINQPEIGFLGLLGKKIDGTLHFLMQAKIEPGNINTIQVSPTLQATKSNYSQVHKGKKPLFLEYFNGQKSVVRLIDQLQSEQGARFLKKRNRNIIVEVPEGEEVQCSDNFMWMTIGQIKDLMRIDNLVNMDTRTVLSCVGYGSFSTDTLSIFSLLFDNAKKNDQMINSALNRDDHLNNFTDIVSWITQLKTQYELSVEKIPLNKVAGWSQKNGEIFHKDRKYFSVIGVRVLIGNREVESWDQPMIKPSQEGLIGFIVKAINGVYHFLVQAKLEPGNFDIVELAPTVQCLTGNYRTGVNEYSVNYIDQFLGARPENIIYSALQSEEGGRFFKEQNRNMIVEVGDDFPIEVADNYCWMTLNQLLRLIEFNNYLNIAARSLISAIKFV